MSNKSKIKPNLFIPGAQKAGSTSLYHYLKDHPEILFSENKELHFFSKEENWGKDNEYYKNFNYESKENIKFIAEGSQSYMFDPKIPKILHDKFGKNIKFIFILRNPAERTFSSYLHLKKRFIEKRKFKEVISFNSIDKKNIILEEKEKIKKAIEKREITNNKEFKKRYHNSYWPFEYINNSFYSIHILNYLKYFDRKNFCFVLTEELNKEPEKVIKKIEKFLKIDTSYLPENLGKRFNYTVIPKEGIFKIIHMIKPYVPNRIKRIVPKKVFHLLFTNKKPKMINKDRKILNKIFEKEFKEIKKITKLNIEKYWN